MGYRQRAANLLTVITDNQYGDTEPKDAVLTIRVSKAELEAIHASARDYGMPTSLFVRTILKMARNVDTSTIDADDSFNEVLEVSGFVEKTKARYSL